ncbi:hypothetical protein AB5J62_21030 [Amycolatopsis sp. cg5]|uniref:LppU/SCO3897 family protein n=1 Tax=Amycolatopsis sp. cg5 TaxID=3238802 RepID=UPI003525C715
MSSTIEVHLTRAEARAGVKRTVQTDEHEYTCDIPARVKDDTTFPLSEGVFLRVRVAKSRSKRPILIGAGVLAALGAFAIVASAIDDSTPGGSPPPPPSSSAPAEARIGQCVTGVTSRVSLKPVPCNSGTFEILDVVKGSTGRDACKLSAATTHTARSLGVTYCLKEN